jgi:hypothetical protein
MTKPQRGTRPPPRTFERFPADAVCPVCGTNDEGGCVLIAIDGTGDGHIAEAKPTHLACAVATQFNREAGVIYRRVEPQDQQLRPR